MLSNMKLNLSVNYIGSYQDEYIYDMRVEGEICGLFTIPLEVVDNIDELLFSEQDWVLRQKDCRN